MDTSLEILDNPLTCEELVELHTQLTQHGGLSLFEAHGLLCALNSGPHILPEELWMPILWSESREFQSSVEVDALTVLILRFNNQIAQQLLLEETFEPYISLETDNAYQDNILNEECRKNLSLWCRGYQQGVQLDHESWTTLINENDDLLSLIFPILTLASNLNAEELISAFSSDLTPSPQELEEIRQNFVESLPNIITAIHDFWCEQGDDLDEPTELIDQVNELLETIDSDALCFCGSHLKFKKCCGLYVGE